MAEEMILETVPWESDEAEDWESDEAIEAIEAIAEAEDTAEDIGERRPARWRRRRRSRYRPGRGVQGLKLRGPEGTVRNIPFPRKLATAAETNRGLARQELGRRALEGRLDQIETRFRAQQKNDSSAAGVVTLLIAGGLTAYSFMKASQKTGGESFSGKWVSEDTAKMATVASATHIATTGAKWLTYGRYHWSGVGMAADAFATAQVAGFAIASLFQPAPPPSFRSVANAAALTDEAKGAKDGDFFYQIDIQRMFVINTDATEVKRPIPL